MAEEPWRPANGTDGCDFENKWCAHCMADKDSRETGDVDGGCTILGYAVCHEAQPLQRVVRHGVPWCTAFEEDKDNPARCLFTEELPL